MAENLAAGLDVPDDPEVTGGDDLVTPAGDTSIVSDILVGNGISDPDRIKFEEEDGTITERSWDNLTKQEQYNILSGGFKSEADDLAQDEVDLINDMRSRGLTPQEYMDAIHRNAQQDVIDRTPTRYEIDDISDDELFVLDALDKYGEDNISDEQLDTLLDNAKADPELYGKTINALRADYKKREDEYNYREQELAQAQYEQDYRNFSENVLNEIQSLQELSGQAIELSRDDMNDIANYVLTRDEFGNTEFNKAINDPQALTRIAFWALKGNDIMNEMASQLQMAYRQGVAAGRQGRAPLVFNDRTDRQAQGNPGKNASSLDVM